MSKQKAALCISFVAIVALGGLVIFSLRRWSNSSICQNTSLLEQTAPGRNLKAVVFQRDCGATTGFSTNVSILSASSPLPGQQGNVFRADNPTTPSSPVVRIEWRSDRELLVAYDSAVDIAVKEDRLGDVAIRFEPSPNK